MSGASGGRAFRNGFIKEKKCLPKNKCLGVAGESILVRENRNEQSLGGVKYEILAQVSWYDWEMDCSKK